MRRYAVRMVAYTIFAVICLSAVATALKLFDMQLGKTTDSLPGHDLEQSERTARTLELFPFEGWHMQAYSSTGDFRLGSMGFAVDFDLLNPPEKTDDEYRIILIGGSGAQGWGASSTEATMASILERLLNAKKDGRRYRVINLAMGSSITYQNFISLNRWGHELAPDIILSYSGINDYTVPIHHEGMLDAHYQFVRLNALAMAARGSEFPPQLVWLRDFLPNLMTKTTIGYGIKYALYPKYFEQRAHESYEASRGLTKRDPNLFLKKIVTPLYIHALRSIRRDFDQIPILVVWQALHQSELELHRKMVPELDANFYEKMFDQVSTELSDDGWYLENFNAFNMRDPHPGVAVHPNDEGQIILANFIFEKLSAVLSKEQH